MPVISGPSHPGMIRVIRVGPMINFSYAKFKT